MKKRGFGDKRGQVTIFIIIAILVVAAGVVIYYFWPSFDSRVSTTSENPNSFIEECMQEEIENVVEKISLQGGSYNVSFGYRFEGNEIEYLCYTNEYYKPCVNQQPFLKNHLEDEILNEISESVDSCFNSLETNYRNEGYEVILNRGETSVELLPKRIVVDFNSELSLMKQESQNYENFRIVLNDNLYELSGIAKSIVDWEAIYGDVDVSDYMFYYHDLKVQKLKQGDGTKIYILTDLNNDKKFQFASRSYVLAPGYQG